MSSGAISGFDPSDFTISGLGFDFASIASITNGGPYPNELVLDLIVSDVWTNASGDTLWNTSSTNWNTPSGQYVDGDYVGFNDTDAGTTNTGIVQIPGTVRPGAITVNNAAVAYVFSGAGSIADAIAGPTSLTKQGPGSLEINMAGNTYSGGTFLLDGVLQVDVSSAADGSSGPLGTGPINLSGGTLQDNGSGVILTNAVNITGNVTLASAGAGSLTFDPQGLALPNVVAISGAPTITVAAPVTINDQIVDGGSTGTLVVNGTSILAVNNANNTYSGGTNLLGGVLQVGVSSIVSGTLVSGPLGTGPINLSGGTLQDDGNGRTLANAVNITGNVTLASAGAGSLTFDPQGLAMPNTVSITGSPTITVAAPVTINDQIVDGGSSGTLVMNGNSVLTINNTNNIYTGGTIVQSGTLSVGPGASDGNSANISNVGLGLVTVEAGGTLMGQNKAMGFGYNTIAAPLFINGGVVTAVTPGGDINSGAGALYSGALTMTGGTINGDNFAVNGPTTINQNATPSIISATNFYLDNTGGRSSTMDVARGTGTWNGVPADLVINSNVGGFGYTAWLNKTGPGTVIFNGTVVIDGTTTISQGTVVVNNTFNGGWDMGAPTFTVGPAGTVSGSGTLTLSRFRRQRHGRSGIRRRRHLVHRFRQHPGVRQHAGL